MAEPAPEPESDPAEVAVAGAPFIDLTDNNQPPPDGSDPESEVQPESTPDSELEDVAEPEDQSEPASEPTPVASLPGPAALSFGAGGLLLATGLLGMLDRARKLRLSEAAERQQPAPPPIELSDIETVLRNSADTPRSHLVYQAVRSLANRPVVMGEPVATPEVIRISRDRVEVVQRGLDSNLPSPWLVGKSPALEFLTDRSLAVLPAERFSDEGASQVSGASPVPACVTVGGGLLINLEAIGLLGVSGPPEQTAGLVRSMVHELATGPDGRSLDIRVSNWIPGAELHQHVQCNPLDHLAEELESWLEGAEMSSAAAGGMNAYGLRVAESEGSMGRSVIVFAEVGDAQALAPLIERARRRALPLAVVLVGDDLAPELGCEAVIRLEARTLKLEPHGFTAATQFLDVDVLQGAERLIGHAGQAAMMPRRDEDSTIDASFDHNTDPAQVPTEETPEHEIVTEMPDEEHEITDQSDDADTGLLIRVLGPIEIEGGPPELTEPERSLITFLALVGPSTEAQILDAVWPTGAIDHDEFEETVARLRGLLGLQFPEPVDGRYRLRSTITDLGSARRWIVQAKSMSDERARSLLQLALADVRGQPFSGGGERHWQWVADHKLAIATQASAMLIDACFDLCDNAYAADDLHLARWACDVGSLVDPLHETVVTRRVQLLQLLNESAEAAEVLEAWEGLYQATAGRPAPQRARLAMQNTKEAAPNVG